MIAAIIAGAAGTIGIAVIVLVLALAVKNAEERAADARVDAAQKAGLLAVSLADVATWKANAADEKRRADALDDVLDEVATSGDAAGARSRVLSRWARASGTDPNPADSNPPSSMPAPPPAIAAVGADGLRRPGS